MNWLVRLFRGSSPCRHSVNSVSQAWRDVNGTPMSSFRCLDCGFFEEGHVYADDWEAKTVFVVNGVVE